MKLQRTFVLVAVFTLTAEGAVITSGTINIFFPTFPGSGFNFSGPGFSPSGGLFTAFCCALIGTQRPGDTVNVLAHFFPEDDGFTGLGSATVEPEPGTWMLAGLGLLLVVADRRRLP